MCKGNRLWTTAKCKDTTNANGIYCNPTINDCAASEPEGCASLDPPKCVRNELYPNIKNCSQYFDCINSSSSKSPQLKSCPPLEYFHPSWRKCVFHTSYKACRAIECPLGVRTTKAHPIEKSFYYECKDQLTTLKQCIHVGEVYDESSQTCVTTCNWKSDGHVFSNPKNCTSYYMCKRNRDRLELVSYDCPIGTGFNSISQKCERDFQHMCNELSILENSFEYILRKLPFGKTASKLAELTMDLADYNPITFALKLGMQQDLVSNIIVVGDYIISSKAFPPTILAAILFKTVEYLPIELRDVAQSLLELIALPQSLSSAHYSLQMESVEDKEPQFPINFRYISRVISEKSVPQILEELQRYFMYHLQLNGENLQEMQRLLRISVPDIIKFTHYNIEHDVFYFTNENLIGIDTDKLFRIFDHKINEITQELRENDADVIAKYVHPILVLHRYYFLEGTRDWIASVRF